MVTTNLSISVVEKRMMNASEAARYCGVALKSFKHVCPVQPVFVPPKNKNYDKVELDKWLDDLKAGSVQFSLNQIVDLIE